MTQQASEKKIVIVDDEMDMRFFLMTLVKSLGCLPVTSKNGKQGLNKIKQEKPDLVTLDVMMPERGGTFIFREMKKDPELVKIPVIIISGVNRDSFYHYLQMLQTGQKINKPGREPKTGLQKIPGVGMIPDIFRIITSKNRLIRNI